MFIVTEYVVYPSSRGNDDIWSRVASSIFSFLFYSLPSPLPLKEGGGRHQ